VEKYDDVELVVFLQDKESKCVTQDIVTVRQAKEGEIPIPDVIECVVWADENTEDYTDKFLINRYVEDATNE
jgi:hypothetical protein